MGVRDTIERMTDVALAYLYGDDDLTIDRVIDKFATSLAEGGAPLERWSLRGNRNAAPAQLAELHGRIATPVLFGGGTLAVVRNPGAPDGPDGGPRGAPRDRSARSGRQWARDRR